MKNQKKWELLKYAYDNYPKGINVMSCHKIEFISSGIFYIDDTGSVSDISVRCVYKKCDDVWAEIIPEQPKKLDKEVKDIAVKIESKKQQIAIEKYLKAKHNDEVDFPAYVYPNDLVVTYFSWDSDCEPHMEIITFDTFAKEHNIKLPLITSEDGVDLYHGSKYRLVEIGIQNRLLDGVGSLCEDHTIFTHPNEYKIFSTKEAALKWIEEQKPKSKEVKLFNGGTANVYREYIMVHGGIKIMPSDMEEIAHALKELS